MAGYLHSYINRLESGSYWRGVTIFMELIHARRKFTTDLKIILKIS